MEREMGYSSQSWVMRPSLWWLERIISIQITWNIFPTDKRDYVIRKRGRGESTLSSKITVHSPLQVPSEDQKFWRRYKVHGIGLTAKSQRKLEPKKPEVSSGFPRGISERLQAWSQQIQRTVAGNWVIIKNF